MPRRSIPFLPDQYYHFYNRGNNRQPVFFARANYLYFLRGIKKYLCGYLDILAYCLLPTHYHILGRVRSGKTSEVLKTSEVSDASKLVSRAMQKFGISYTKAMNKRFGRVGALFQGQFQAKPIRYYNHLLNLCIYIHANPVKNGLVKLPEDWEFSNYPEWLNLRDGTLVDRELISAIFGTVEEYKTLVMEYVRTGYLPDNVRKYLQELED
jgi:putative transposase